VGNTRVLAPRDFFIGFIPETLFDLDLRGAAEPA
jgi:hypothetical protein